MNDIDKMPVKCRDCAYWEIAREPYVCTDCESRMERLSDLSRPKTDDYIKRSDALKAILGVSIYDTIEELDGARTIAENTWADGLYDAYKIIEEEVDAADVEPVRHGRWVGMKEYCQHLFDITGERYVMSQLGISLPHCNQCWAENESRKPFCPNCGAKMDVEPPKEATP